MNTRRLVSLSTFLTALFALTTSTVFAASFLTYGNGAWNAPSVWGAASVFGTVGSAEKQFEVPTGITVDSNGNIYTSEQDNHRIQKFDSTGTFISAWGWGVSDGANHYEICTSNCQAGILGTGDGQFSGTYDIIATGTVIYVVDLVAGQVQELSTDGTFITKWPTGPNGIVTGGDYDPEGLAVDGNGNIYMQGISTAQIKKFDSSGTFISAWGWGVTDGASHYEICTSNCQFGATGGGDGELDHPTHVEVHGTNVYVSDYLNHRITQYDTSGNFIAVWGWGVQDGASHYEVCTSGCQAGIEGAGDGQFNVAEGIRTDTNGNVFVADAGNDNVQEFSSTGTFIKKWGSRGTSAGQFDHGPLGLALDSSNNVYVAEVNGSFRIHKFDESGNPVLFHDCSLSSNCAAGTDYPGSSDDVTIRNGSTVAVPASSFSLGSLNILSGSTLSQGAGSALTLSGFWNNSGTYSAAPDASVILNGTSQFILGNTPFANLTKSVSSADTLSFDANSTFAVSGTLSLSGAVDNLLSVVKLAFSVPTWSSEFTYTPSDYPSAIAVDGSGNIYIGDCGTNPAVYKFDSSGTLTQTIGLGTISCSYGVGVDSDGNLYAADSSVLRKYNSSGTQLASWGRDGVGGSQSFVFAAGVVVENDKVYVADWTDDTTAAIFVFDTDGNFLNSFGTGLLNGPVFINADSQGNIYVPDSSTDTIYKYSSGGTLLQTISNVPGVVRNDLTVEGVAVDSNGYIYAAQFNGSEVQVADPSGHFFTTFGSAGTGHGQFTFGDASLTFDSHGNLYTVDDNSSSDLRIQKFSPGASPSTWNISAGSTDFSFLSVSNSTAASAFTCTNGCVDGGGNTNWVFTVPTPPPAPVVSSGGGWSGGCSTYPQGEVPSWGVVPCTPTSASQGPAVLSGTQPSSTPTSSPPLSSNTNQLTETQIQSVLSLLASFGADQATINNINSVLHGQAVAPSSSSTTAVLTRDLELGDTGEDVRTLQEFLNTHGYQLANYGPGSPGNETTKFGYATQYQLAQFQKAHDITPATGYFGPKTRALINQ